MKNTLDGININSRLGDSEECTSDIENRIMKVTKSEQQKKKKENKLKNKCSVKDLNQHKVLTFALLGVPEKKEGEKRIGNIFDKIMVENFLKLKKETDF